MKNSIIGFSFKIRLHWLGNAAACAAEGLNQEQSRSNLVKIVSTEYKGEKSQKNTASILARIWCRPNEKAKGLQKRAISLVPKVESNELIGIHWAMTIAAFPFFADTVTNIGRLMSLQESITASQILLRLKQYWGDKPKVNKSLINPALTKLTLIKIILINMTPNTLFLLFINITNFFTL